MSENIKNHISLEADKIEAKYCDQVIVSKSPFGFVFDFAQQLPQMHMLRIFSRVAMSPQQAKFFFERFRRNLNDYEKQFGRIVVTDEMKQQHIPTRKIGFTIEE